MEQLRVARAEYRKRFHELSARLLLQTRTWRSLHIRKRNFGTEISALQRKCNALMEDFVKLETLRIEEQQEIMRILSEIPPTDGAAKVQVLEKVNELNLNELSEGLSLRWELLEQIAIGVEKVEDFVRGLKPGKEKGLRT
jgi:hypothetical protein